MYDLNGTGIILLRMAKFKVDDLFKQAVAAHKAEKIKDAEHLYRVILKAQPQHPDANHNMGVIAVGSGELELALPFLKTALEAKPSVLQFWYVFIDALIKVGKLGDAESVLATAQEIGLKSSGFSERDRQLSVYRKNRSSRMFDGTKKAGSPTNILDTLTPTQAIKQANLFLKEGSPREAKKIYLDILGRFPNNTKAKEGMNSILGFPKVKRGRVLEPSPEQLQPLIGLQNRGEYKSVLNEAIELLKRFPRSITLYNLCGAAHAGVGSYDASLVSYQRALEINPNDSETHQNMGAVRRDRGDHKAAIISYKKALKANPASFRAHAGIGSITSQIGDWEAAIISYKRAIQVKPNDAGLHYNLGLALANNDNYDESKLSIEQAIEIKPNYTEAYVVLGGLWAQQGFITEAIDYYKKALATNQTCEEACFNLVNVMVNKTFHEPSTFWQEIIELALTYKTHVRPSKLIAPALTLLKFEPQMKKLFSAHSQGHIFEFYKDSVEAIIELPLLLRLMSLTTLANLELELIFTVLRSNLISSTLKTCQSNKFLRFQSALALNCFANEYIFNESTADTALLKELETLVERQLLNGEKPSSGSILCLASYRPLYQYNWIDLVTVEGDLEEVFQRQVLEPRQEIRLKTNIPTLAKIMDKVSLKVRNQYEENPYPRWVNTGLYFVPLRALEVFKQQKIRLFDELAADFEAPSILVAGCGTGQHSLSTAARFKNSKVLAIDLSLSSLAYAKRKTAEYGLQNINHLQADILELAQLKRQFEIVESCGTLHHMEDPMAGWRVLTDCLKLGGMMKIALYSELARQDVVMLRKEIQQLGIGSDVASMKLFRHSIANSDKSHHKLISQTRDFHSLSELRDLLFHVQEKRFTIPQIKECMSELGLKFCGFELVGNQEKNFELENSGLNARYDLDKWQLFEEANPLMFRGMYQFWCQKEV